MEIKEINIYDVIEKNLNLKIFSCPSKINRVI